MLKRVMAAALGIPLFVYAVYLGGEVHLALVGAIAILGFREFQRMLGRKGLDFPKFLGYVATALYLLDAFIFGQKFSGLVFTLGLVVGSCWIALGGRVDRVQDLCLSIFGALYLGWLLSFLIMLRRMDGGTGYELLTLAVTWANDTAAYFAGSRWGRIRISPAVSPAKTLEGALGGVIAGVAAAAVLGRWIGVSVSHWPILGMALAVSGQMGDLFESALKRFAGIKDSGGMIPGHGGILDRFDSLLFTAPVAYYLLLL